MAMKQAYRQFQCDKCGTIHVIKTNHTGQVHKQKCKNWPCTPGEFDMVSMTYFTGKTDVVESTFYSANGGNNLVKLRVNPVNYTQWRDG